MKEDFARDGIVERLTEKELEEIAKNISLAAAELEMSNFTKKEIPEVLVRCVRESLRSWINQAPPLSDYEKEVCDITSGDLSLLVKGLEKTGLLSKKVLEDFELGIALDADNNIREKIVEELTEERLTYTANYILSSIEFMQDTFEDDPEILVGCARISLRSWVYDQALPLSGYKKEVRDIISGDLTFLVKELEKADLLPKKVLEDFKRGIALDAKVEERKRSGVSDEPDSIYISASDRVRIGLPEKEPLSVYTYTPDRTLIGLPEEEPDLMSPEL